MFVSVSSRELYMLNVCCLRLYTVRTLSVRVVYSTPLLTYVLSLFSYFLPQVPTNRHSGVLPQPRERPRGDRR